MAEAEAMPRYSGTKELFARPMTLGAYNDYRGWAMPANEDPAAPGYLVEYTDGGKPNDERHAGYISWSPADVFGRAYHRIDGTFDFGQAIRLMKAGAIISRVGWNGKGMFLYYVPEGRYPARTAAASEIAYAQTDGLVPYRAYIAMMTAQGDVVPWVASQSDVLAVDWIEGEN